MLTIMVMLPRLLLMTAKHYLVHAPVLLIYRNYSPLNDNIWIKKHKNISKKHLESMRMGK